MALYQSKKYKVLVGQSTNLSLCTCWFDPFTIESKYPQLKEKVAITGTLYSKEGVSIILRNLALNPNIRYLLIWANTPLSNTPFGKAGRELLESIWKDPTNISEIHAEIGSDTVVKIAQNVELINLSDKTFEQVVEFISSQDFKETAIYMEPIDFPEPKRDETATMPSEKVGWVVRDKTLYGAWISAIDRVLRYGHKKQTEYGNFQRELHNVTWVIHEENPDNIFVPDIDSKVKEIVGLAADSLSKYKESLLDPVVPVGTAYTYGSRLRAFGETAFDQVNFLIDKLKEQPVSRRVVATTLIPTYDSTQKSPPCLVFVQAMTDEKNKLNFFAVFRSHDMFKAAIPNAYGLLNLQEYICKQTGLERGVLSINSISAHIYEEDWDNAFKLIKCQKWEAVNPEYDEHEELDPRGIVRIYLADEKIVLEIVSFSGETLYKCVAKTAREVIMNVAKLDLLSRADHYADICIQLVKAEIALQAKKEFIQDKVFRGDGFSFR